MGQTNNLPLLSISATGTIGNAWTFETWRGCDYVRKYAKPTPSQSEAARRQKRGFGACASFWARYGHNRHIRSSWEEYQRKAKPVSTAENRYMQNMLRAIASTEDASGVSNIEHRNGQIMIEFRKLLTREIPPDGTSFVIRRLGPSSWMEYYTTLNTTSGRIYIDPNTLPEGTISVQVFMGKIPLTGLVNVNSVMSGE